MTIPPYAAGCVCTILAGWGSDRMRLRGPFIMACALLAIVGYSMLYATSPTKLPGVGYAGAILAACGVFPTVPLMLAWGAGNAGSSLKRAVIIGLQSCIGNLGGYVDAVCSALYTQCRRSICSSFIYRTQDTPRFHLGHGKVFVTALVKKLLTLSISHRPVFLVYGIRCGSMYDPFVQSIEQLEARAVLA